MLRLGLNQVRGDRFQLHKADLQQFFKKQVLPQYQNFLVNADPQTDVQQQQSSAQPLNGSEPYVPQNLSTEQLEEIQQLIKVANESDIVELKLSSPRFSLQLKKKEALEHEEQQKLKEIMSNNSGGQQGFPQFMSPQFMQGGMQTMPQQAPQSQTETPQPEAAAQPEAPAAPQEEVIDGTPLQCPIAGTFYRSPSPSEPAFVKEGDVVKKGQVVCIVEAMKMMNEIEAETDGTIVKFVAQNQSIVRPGDHLVIIK